MASTGEFVFLWKDSNADAPESLECERIIAVDLPARLKEISRTWLQPGEKGGVIDVLGIW